MILLDVNVLVSAFREEAPDDVAVREWLVGVVEGESSYGVSELVLSGFLRIVTHPKVFDSTDSARARARVCTGHSVAAELHRAGTRPPTLGHLRGTQSARECARKSRARCLSRGIGDRIW